MLRTRFRYGLKRSSPRSVEIISSVQVFEGTPKTMSFLHFGHPGTNFTNAVVDRVAFDNSDMRGVKFLNTVLSGSTFVGANLEDASFEDALIGYVDIKNLCRNPTLSDTNKEELGCK